jgi:spermidine synthase
MGKIGKQNRWQVLLSHLWEIPIEHSSSAYNPELTVYLRRGRYMLTTSRAIYSYDDLYTNFRDAFEQVRIAERPVQKVLLLGLGLGSIPYMLERYFGQRYHYTAVEIDEEILYLANKYVLSELDSPIDVLTADARYFLAGDKETYDLICVDIFQDDAIPVDMLQTDFLQYVQRRLAPEGILMFNHLAVTMADRKQGDQYFETVFKPIFPEGACLDVHSNYILMNRPWHLPGS